MRAGECQRLASGPGAEIEDLFARSGADEQRGDLAPLVLDLEAPALETLLDLYVRVTSRPRGRVGCEGQPASMESRSAPRRASCPRDLVAIRLQRVDTEVERRPPGERRSLVHPVSAERQLENAGRARQEGRRGCGRAQSQGRATRSRRSVSSESGGGAWRSVANAAFSAARFFSPFEDRHPEH